MRVLIVFSLISICSASSDSRLEVSSPVTFSDPRYNKLSWFVHINDIHISSWEDDTRQSQVRRNVHVLKSFSKLLIQKHSKYSIVWLKENLTFFKLLTFNSYFSYNNLWRTASPLYSLSL